MRKISASYILTGTRPPLKNGIVFCKEDGTIIEVRDTGGKLQELAGLEQYSGILVPGFVNAHCHLELSHLKGKIPEKTGLVGFLSTLNRLRNQDEQEVATASEKADFQMQHAGVVAVGDVSNSSATLNIKTNSRLYYHTFAEAFGFLPARAQKAYNLAERVTEEFGKAGLPASMTPHSAYSVSEPLFLLIKEKVQPNNSILSMHCMESPAEKIFFNSGSGPLFHHLKHIPGLNTACWKPKAKDLLEGVLSYLPSDSPLLLVHNTFATADDIATIKKHRKLENTFFVLCPNANLYIENQLPPVPLFQAESLNICLGTDSLASNHQLSVLQEMITLQKHFPEISLAQLIEWACTNGARALGAANRFGSLTPGKKPGINLITGADLQHLRLTPASRVKVLQQPA